VAMAARIKTRASSLSSAIRIRNISPTSPRDDCVVYPTFSVSKLSPWGMQCNTGFPLVEPRQLLASRSWNANARENERTAFRSVCHASGRMTNAGGRAKFASGFGLIHSPSVTFERCFVNIVP
jgi:hypothetical protein